jgi:hypothetical protein
MGTARKNGNAKMKIVVLVYTGHQGERRRRPPTSAHSCLLRVPLGAVVGVGDHGTIGVAASKSIVVWPAEGKIGEIKEACASNCSKREPEHGTRCVVPQRSLTLRLSLRTVKKQKTQRFIAHVYAYSPIGSSSSLSSWPTWLNAVPIV